MKQAKYTEKLKGILRVSLIAVVLFAISEKTYAQYDESPVSFTIRAGINSSNSTEPTTTSRTGFVGGIAMDYGQTMIFIRTGLDFATRGYKYKEGSTNYTANLSYLHVPIHAAYRLNLSEPMSLVFHGGPFISYAISGHRKNEETGETSRLLGQHQLYRYDYGVGLGLSGEYKSIVLGLAADWGIQNMNEDGLGSNKSKAFYLTLGYKFRL